MKKLSILLVVMFILLTSCSVVNDNNIAKINGKNISFDELFKYIPQAQFESLSKEEKIAQVNRVCDDYLMKEYLEDIGDLDKGDVAWEIRVWEIRELANGAFQKLIINTVLNEKAIRAYYEKMKYDLNISHILIGFDNDKKLNSRSKSEAQALAYDIYNKITDKNFSELALEYSDDSSVINNQGNLGWAGVGKWIGDFEDIAYSLEPGEVSEPIETMYGFHIIKINERKRNIVEPFEKAKIEIEEIAMDSWRPKFIEQEKIVMDSLNNIYTININEDKLADFLERYNRLSQNVFYSKQFNTFDIMEVFDDSLSLGMIGNVDINKKMIVDFLKMISLNQPPRFTDIASFNSFIGTSRMGIIFYDTALNIKLDQSDEYIKTKNVYLAKKSSNLFDKLYVYESINPDKETLNAFYESEKSQLYYLEPRVKVKEVLLEDSLQAVNIYKQVLKGEDISILAEKYSKRNIGKKNKGIIPAFKKNQYGEMSLAAFNMLDGEVAGPYKIGKYFSVIQRLEYIPESFKPIENIQYRLLSDYRKHHLDTVRDEQMDMLRNLYKLSINKKFINNDK